MKKSVCFNNIKIYFILFFIFYIVYLIVFPHEAFCMDPYDNITSDEDMISDEDVRNELIIARKEGYVSHSGKYTYHTREDLCESLYPKGLPIDSNIINDYYDGEKYFDIPLKMIFGQSQNTELSADVYSGCKARSIDGLLIWPEHFSFQAEFVKDYTQVIAKDSNIPSVSLGTRVMDRFVFVYIKCEDINKRKYHWTIWERTHIASYWSYKAFKKRWDSETNVWSNIDENIRKDIIIEVKDLLGLKRLNGNVRKSVRSEVEKLIHKTKPFSTMPS
jgi:hypothetical protein